MAAVKDHRANTASAKTFPDCTTTSNTPTACLRVLMEQHEHVHRRECRAHVSEHSAISEAFGGRWHTLADYAREEIEAYEAERAYIEAALTKLESDVASRSSSTRPSPARRRRRGPMRRPGSTPGALSARLHVDGPHRLASAQLQHPRVDRRGWWAIRCSSSSRSPVMPLRKAPATYRSKCARRG